MATGPSNNPPPAAAAAPDAAQKEQEKREAVQKLRERQQQNNAADQYKDTHFWTYWERLGTPTPAADPLTGNLSGKSDDDRLLEPGDYVKRGVRWWVPRSRPVLAHFDYDADKKAFTVSMDILEFEYGAGITGSMVKWDIAPLNKAGFDRHARIMGQEQVRFLAGKPNCFSKVALNFKDGHPFQTGDGNIGSNTLAYAEAQVAAALEEAMACGVEFEVSPNFIKAVRDKRVLHEIVDPDGSKHYISGVEEEIRRVNGNAKRHQIVNGFANEGVLRQHQKALMGVGNLSTTDIASFSQGMVNDIDAQDKKIKALEKDIAALGAPAAGTPDATKLSQLQAQLVVEKDRLIELKAEKASLDGEMSKVKDSEDLQQLKDQWEAAKNPQQPLKDAVDELKGAIAGVADMNAYKDPTGKNGLQELKDRLAKLESSLAKDMNKTERDKVENELQAIFKELKKLSYPNDNEKNKILDAVNKAEKLGAVGEKVKVDAAKRLDGRVDNLEKAVAQLNKAYDEYNDFKPQELVGMVIGRKAAHERGRFNRIESPQQAQKYIDDRFNALQQNRKDLQDQILLEKGKLDYQAGKKFLPDDERARIENRLKEIQKQIDNLPDMKAKAAAAAAPAAPKGP